MPIQTSSTRATGLGSRALTLLLTLTMASCVTVDAETQEVLPRGGQQFHFDDVKRYAEELEVGMTQYQVRLKLGSPAEKSGKGDRWIYLPERPAVLIPSKALQLEFDGDRLEKFGYRAIVLGTKL